MRIARQFASLCLIVAVAAGAAANAMGAPPPVESFFATPAFGGAVMSPDGSKLAIRTLGANGRLRLAVVDLGTMQTEVVASFDEDDIGHIRWVNDKRIVFDLADLKSSHGDIQAAPGLFAVTADGSGFRQLVERRGHFFSNPHDNKLLPWNTFLLDSVGSQTGNDVFVFKPAQDHAKDYHFFLQRLNTVTGAVEDVESPPDAIDWVVDDAGEPRAALTSTRNTGALHIREPGGPWSKVAEFDWLHGDSLQPRLVTADGQLFVEANRGLDKRAIWTYDLKARKFADAPLLVSDKYDLHAKYVTSASKLLGVRYTIDADVTQWFDADMQALQATIDKMLPNTANRVSPPRRGNGKLVLVEAHSDVLPGMTLLFDREQKKLMRVGTSRPEVDSKQMARMDMIRYKARDGLEIPAYLSVPRGAEKRNLPLVVLVHGGPWVRGQVWGWDDEVQFLASRGYAVLQPEFRGSSGFGSRHFHAGWKQWGKAMQDDIADGVQWAIKEGIADPARVCIAGASYGGYSVLMGLANDPALYRCGIAWAGVTDIDLMYTVRWSDHSDTVKQYGFPTLIGDPVTDAAQIKATSPIQNAAKIRAPLLLAYGKLDDRVPIIHGEKFRDAIKPHNANVEWVVYDDEAHGWRSPKTNIDFWTRVEKFLARHLAKP